MHQPKTIRNFSLVQRCKCFSEGPSQQFKALTRPIYTFQTCCSSTQGDVDFQSHPWPHISLAAKDCVRQLLTADASKRPTARQILQVRLT